MDEQVISKRRQGEKEGRMFETSGVKKDMGLMYMYTNNYDNSSKWKKKNKSVNLPADQVQVNWASVITRCLKNIWFVNHHQDVFLLGGEASSWVRENYITPGMCLPKWQMI